MQGSFGTGVVAQQPGSHCACAAQEKDSHCPTSQSGQQTSHAARTRLGGKALHCDVAGMGLQLSGDNPMQRALVYK